MRLTHVLHMLLLLAVPTAARADDVRLRGAGSPFPGPLYARWAAEYGRARRGVTVDYQSVGSRGIDAFAARDVLFCGIDRPLSDKDVARLGGADALVTIPTVGGAVALCYNLPGVDALNLTGPLAADLFLGAVARWDAAPLAAISARAKLPASAVTPVWRARGSGTTWLITQYLAGQSEAFARRVGTGTAVKWPVGVGVAGGAGPVGVLAEAEGSVTYLELGYARANRVPVAAVRNRAGRYVLPTPASVTAAIEVAAADVKGDTLTVSLLDRAGDDAYPIAGLTYVVVHRDTRLCKSFGEAKALADFLWYATHDGQKLAADLGYAPLGDAMTKHVERALSSLHYEGKPLLPAKHK